jgi:hypothetical protein
VYGVPAQGNYILVGLVGAAAVPRSNINVASRVGP